MINYKVLIIIALLFYFNLSSAGRFLILVSADEGIETVDQIYNEYNISNSVQTLITIFDDFPPESLEYALTFRPSSPPSNPESNSGRLYRRLYVDYDYPADVTPVMDFLQNSSLIETVVYNHNLDPVNYLPEFPNDVDSTVIELAFMPYFDCQTPALNLQGLAYDIEVVGNTINLWRVGSDPRPPSTFICGLRETEMIAYEIGLLSAGFYTVKIFNATRSTEFPLPTPGNEFGMIGQTTLVVRGTKAVSVPTLSYWSLLLLALSLFAFAIYIAPKKI